MQTKGKVPLHRFAFDSPNFVSGLKIVSREIRAGQEESELDLCYRARITLDELRLILRSYSIAEVEAAIAERDARRSQANQEVHPDKTQPIGWWAEWQQAMDRWEEARAENLRGIERMKKRGPETE